jgi:hypothetical protein
MSDISLKLRKQLVNSLRLRNLVEVIDTIITDQPRNYCSDDIRIFLSCLQQAFDTPICGSMKEAIFMRDMIDEAAHKVLTEETG